MFNTVYRTNQGQRLLVVQRTGWGKSVVYSLATKILRDQGAGPTLLISPLLSLMRNQIRARRRPKRKYRTASSKSAICSARSRSRARFRVGRCCSWTTWWIPGGR